MAGRDWEALKAGIEEKKFNMKAPRISNNRIFLTYKTHINKKELEAFINKLSCKYSKLKKDAARIEIAHENGDKINNYPHTHVAIDFGSLFDCKSKNCMLLFDWEYEDDDGEEQVIHPHIEVIKTNIHWNNALVYLSKEDPENAHLKNEGKSGGEIDIDSVIEAPNDLEAIKLAANKWSDVTGILATRRAKRGVRRIGTKFTKVDRNEHKWWQKVFEIHESPNEPRLIHWFYDKEGGAGKTQLCKYLRQEYKFDWVTLGITNRSCDAAEFLDAHADNGWNGHGVVMDIPRRASEFDSIYGVLEEIKNGYIASWKNHTKQLECENPHVIVMSNRLPKVSKMSKNRWRIYEIKNDEATLMDTRTASKMQKEWEIKKELKKRDKYIKSLGEIEEYKFEDQASDSESDNE